MKIELINPLFWILLFVAGLFGILINWLLWGRSYIKEIRQLKTQAILDKIVYKENPLDTEIMNTISSYHDKYIAFKGDENIFLGVLVRFLTKRYTSNIGFYHLCGLISMDDKQLEKNGRDVCYKLFLNTFSSDAVQEHFFKLLDGVIDEICNTPGKENEANKLLDELKKPQFDSFQPFKQRRRSLEIVRCIAVNP